MQYLMLANIKNGLIDKELPYLKSIDKKNDKYCLSNHCLILSKNGYCLLYTSCRGMNSPKAYKAWLNEIEKKEKSKATRVWFKYKEGYFCKSFIKVYTDLYAREDYYS